jgi:hypothetical protein
VPGGAAWTAVALVRSQPFNASRMAFEVTRA